MTISLDEVKKVAKLSRLKIEENALQKFSGQLSNILEYASKINELDTDSIPPTSHSIPMKNVFREDAVINSFDRTSIMQNAPIAENGFYKAPKIIE